MNATGKILCKRYPSEDLPHTLGNRIREARLRADLTQHQLAEYVNLSPTYISNIERGRSQISLPTLIDLAYVLQTTPNSLLQDWLQLDHSKLTSQISEIMTKALDEVLQMCDDCAS